MVYDDRMLELFTLALRIPDPSEFSDDGRRKAARRQIVYLLVGAPTGLEVRIPRKEERDQILVNWFNDQLFPFLARRGFRELHVPVIVAGGREFLTQPDVGFVESGASLVKVLAQPLRQTRRAPEE